MSRIKSHMAVLEGYFKAKAFEDDKCTYSFEKENKIVLGTGRLISRLLAAKTQDWTPTSNDFGITKFMLFGIDPTVTSPDCSSQMLIGEYEEYYSSLDPVSLTEIDSTSFPCLKDADTIAVETVPVNDCASLIMPGSGLATMSSDVDANYIDICMRVGPGWVIPGQVKYYGMASLVGKSPDPNSIIEYILAMEQFPVMTKSDNATFKFSWEVYI